MCGLFGGASSYLSSFEVDIVIQLGLISQLRGVDSTGIAVATRGKKGATDVDILKDVGHSTDFFNTDGVIPALNKHRPMFIMGHCRAATVGTVTKENAHPYKEGNIVGAHNGTIPSLGTVDGKQTTDSRHLFTRINNMGLEKALGTFNFGAYALTYFNRKNNTLNFLRNSERPLYFMYTDGGATLYWASEKGMLKLVAERNSGMFREPFLLEAGMLFSFTPGLMQGRVHKVEVVRPAQQLGNYGTPMLPPPPPTTIEPSEVEEEGASSGLDHPHAPPGRDTEAPRTNRPLATKSDKSGKTLSLPKPSGEPTTNSGSGVPLIPLAPNGRVTGEASLYRSNTGNTALGWYRGFRGKTMTAEKAETVLMNGCANCGKIHSLTDARASLFFSNEAYLCGHCVTDPFVKEYCKAAEFYPGAYIPPYEGQTLQ